MVQILICVVIGLLDIRRRSFSTAALIDKRDLIGLDNVALELVEKFSICDNNWDDLSVAAMHGRIYAVCKFTSDIRVFDSTTYQRLDDIVVDLDDGFSRKQIASCPDSKSLFLVDHTWDSGSKMKVLKVDVTDNSHSVWMTKNASDATAFSISPFDCRLIFTMWKNDDNDKVQNTIVVYDQEGQLVKTVPMPLDIEFPDTVLETNVGTYLVAEGLMSDIPYVLKHLDRNGKVLETVRRDDTEHNEADSEIYDMVGIAVDSLGFIYGAGVSSRIGATGELIVFDQAMRRNRVLITWIKSEVATNVLYDDYTDRVLVYMPACKSMAAFAIRINVTCYL